MVIEEFDGRNFSLKMDSKTLKVLYHLLSSTGSVQHDMVTTSMRQAGFTFNQSDSEVVARQAAMTIELLAKNIMFLSADEVRRAKQAEENGEEEPVVVTH
jgi:hypothetical protein